MPLLLRRHAFLPFEQAMDGEGYDGFGLAASALTKDRAALPLWVNAVDKVSDLRSELLLGGDVERCGALGLPPWGRMLRRTVPLDLLALT